VVVVMRYWADMSVEQVADLLGCSAGNVKSQAARGLVKLRAVLGEAGLTGLAERSADQPWSDGGSRHG
jgi:DNA-directed RNA polymerase specialized sigma24 family protein